MKYYSCAIVHSVDYSGIIHLDCIVNIFEAIQLQLHLVFRISCSCSRVLGLILIFFIFLKFKNVVLDDNKKNCDKKLFHYYGYDMIYIMKIYTRNHSHFIIYYQLSNGSLKIKDDCPCWKNQTN